MADKAVAIVMGPLEGAASNFAAAAALFLVFAVCRRWMKLLLD